MKNLKTLSTLAIVALSATGALAFDLPTTAAVEVVEGISMVQVTQMNFGQVADHGRDAEGQEKRVAPGGLAFDRFVGQAVALDEEHDQVDAEQQQHKADQELAAAD